MKITFLTNEYPPNVYGGAGVHVEYLSRELARLDGGAHYVDVLCFGEQRRNESNLSVRGINSRFAFESQDSRHLKVFDAFFKDIEMAGLVCGADIVHCHTWYSHFGGLLARRLYGIPLVVTMHSLEPHRPWKAEQLGSAYEVTKWVERTAYRDADGIIAVSSHSKNTVIDLYGVAPEKVRVIHNGIDPEVYKPAYNPAVLKRYGIRADKQFALFVGRISRQKGITHLVNAIKYLSPGVQVVLCAGAPDTESIAEEMKRAVDEARRTASNDIIWIPEMLPREEVIVLYTHASVFACPSVYEPFGLINLEAMACKTPVVASAIGGIPEVVVPGETGLLVELEQTSPADFEPLDPERFASDLASALNTLLESPETQRRMGEAARRRVEDHFTWARCARKTLDFYRELKKP